MTIAFTLQPAHASHDVDPSASLLLTLRADTGTIDVDALDVTVGGVAAVSSGVVQRPAFTGTVDDQGALVVVALRPRRRFLYGVNVAVVVAADEVVSMTPTTFSTTGTFSIREIGSRLLDPTLRATRVDRPFVDVPALELHRMTLLGALAGAPGSASVVQLYYRVFASQLRALTSQLGVPASVAAEATRLRRADVASLVACDTSLEAVRALWESALRELLGLGVAPTDVQLLLRSGNSGNFQERVAAACAALLLAVAAHERRENAPVFTIVNQSGA